MITAQWQEWQEPREYVSFDKAQELMALAVGLQHDKFPDKKRMWSSSTAPRIWDMSVGREHGEIFRVKSIPIEYLTPHWYVVAPAPESENDSTEPIDLPEPCRSCKNKVRSCDEHPCSVCVHNIDAVRDEDYCNQFQPICVKQVFDLTYEEALAYSKENSNYVQAEGMDHDEFYYFNTGCDEWLDSSALKMHDVYNSSYSTMALAGKMWRKF